MAFDACCFGQCDGNVQVEGADTRLVVDKTSTSVLLGVVLTALRAEGDEAKLDVAAMSSVAMLGWKRILKFAEAAEAEAEDEVSRG